MCLPRNELALSLQDSISSIKNVEQITLLQLPNTKYVIYMIFRKAALYFIMRMISGLVVFKCSVLIY